MNETKQRTNKTNQNNRRENTRTNIHTPMRAYTLKETSPMMIIKTKETQIFIFIYICIYQESDVVTGVDDANLRVFVGGWMR